MTSSSRWADGSIGDTDYAKIGGAYAGGWDRRHGTLRSQPSYEGSLVLLTASAR